MGAMHSKRRTSTIMMVGATAETSELVQKPLPYGLDGLEPVISKELMEYHYGKHHVTYIANYNKLQKEAADALANGDAQKFTELTQAIKFNGGGHLNHEFFWDNLCSPGDFKDLGKGDLHTKITESFGSMEKFIETFSAKTAGV